MQDPLSCDLTSIETTRPILAGARMQLRIDKVEISPTKDNAGRYIAIQAATVDPQKDMKNGNMVEPGHTLFEQIMITPTGKSTQDMVNRKLGEVVQAARLQGQIRPDNVDSWVKQLEGRLIFAQVDFEPETVGKDGRRYDAKNVISKYLKQ